MQVSVTFKHLEPTDAIRSYAEDKVGKIKKYLDNPVDANVVLSVEKFRHIAEVNLMVNGIAVAATDATEDMYSSIDNVMDKIERQLRRHKERIKKHKPRNNHDSAALEETVYSSESMDAEELVACLEQAQQGVPPFSWSAANGVCSEDRRENANAAYDKWIYDPFQMTCKVPKSQS